MVSNRSIKSVVVNSESEAVEAEWSLSDASSTKKYPSQPKFSVDSSYCEMVLLLCELASFAALLTTFAAL